MTFHRICRERGSKSNVGRLRRMMLASTSELGALLAPPPSAMPTPPPPRAPATASFAAVATVPSKCAMNEEGSGACDRDEAAFLERRAAAATMTGRHAHGPKSAHRSQTARQAVITARKEADARKMKAVLTARKEADEKLQAARERAQRERASKAAKRAASPQRGSGRPATPDKAAAAAEPNTAPVPPAGTAMGMGGASASASAVTSAVASAEEGGGADALSLGFQQLKIAVPSAAPSAVPSLGSASGSKKGAVLGSKKGAKAGKSPFSLALPAKQEPVFQQWQEWKTGPVPKAKAAQAEMDKLARPAWAASAPPPLVSLATLAKKQTKTAGAQHGGLQSGGAVTGAADPADEVEPPAELVALLGASTACAS